MESINSIRSSLVGKMEAAYIASDDSFTLLDVNEHAKILFPKLNGLMPSDPLPEEMRPLFSENEDHVRIKDRYFEKKLISVGSDREVNCLVLIDCTDIDRLNKELEKARLDAEETTITKSIFLSNVSHEIRTPMNAIVGMADILLRDGVEDEIKEKLEKIKLSADDLLDIVSDILDISRIEDGSLNIEEEEYEPMSVLHDLSMILSKKIADKPVELLYMIDPEMPSKLRGDSGRIRKIIMNMMNNAIEYTDSGFISLSVFVEERYDDYCVLSFSVADSGQGIREEDKGDLFSPFQKLDKRNREEGEGLGFGLSVCKQLVRLMGGKIGVDSTYGTGSRFYFTLSQGIANEKAAAGIKDKSKTRHIIYSFKNSYLEENVIELAEQYGIDIAPFKEDILVRNNFWDGYYFFTDDISSLSEENEKRLRDSGVEICVLQNPVRKAEKHDGRTLVNKPVYSLNFCQIMNGTSSGDRDHELNFTAPDARILVVDDNEMNLQVAKGLLSPLKMQIDLAEDGKAGVECVLGNTYDIIFMDHMMPVMDGVEALNRIRSMKGGIYSKIPVIALSANATDEAEELFREKGFSDFVAKPIRVKEFIKCVKRWLPDEKIIQASSESATQTIDQDEERESAEKEAFVKEILPEKIEGIDIEYGVSCCGSPALFLKCLVIFYKIIDKKTKIMEKCLEDALIRDLTIEVHALKNSARMIGALKLSDDFKELESLGNNEDLEALKEKTPGVLELYQSYKAVLKPFSENETEGYRVPEKEEVIEKLNRIKEAIDDFDMDGADAAMSELRHFSLPVAVNDGIMELDALVSDFAMEDVVALADELIELCEREMGG